MYIEDYETLVVKAEVGIIRVDSRCVIRFANPCMVRMLQRGSDSELIGKRLTEIVARDDRRKVIEKFHRRRMLIAESYAISFLGKDGSALPCTLSAVPLQEGGKFKGSFAMVRDMSQVEMLLDRLKSSEEWFRNLAKQLPAAIFELDSESRICYANDYAGALIGLGAQCGQAFLRSFVAEDEGARYDKHLAAAFAGNEAPPFPLDFLREGRERLPALWSMALESWRAGQPRVSVVVIEVESALAPAVTFDEGFFLPYRLTDREQAVAKRLITGAMYKEIAFDLGISLPTVRTHTMSLYRKMDIHARDELVRRAQAWQASRYGASRLFSMFLKALPFQGLG